MEVDPVAIFFNLLKFAIVILVIVLFFYVYGSFYNSLKSSDMDRYTTEVSEIIANSPTVVTEKYIFNPVGLSSLNNKYTNLGHQCEFDYTANLKDLANGNEWNFYGYNYEAGSTINNNEIEEANVRTFYVGVAGTPIHPATLTITAEHSYFTEITCAVQKAYYLKGVYNVTLPRCLIGGLDPQLCFSLKRKSSNNDAVNDLVCYYETTSSGGIRWDECRYLPPKIKIDDNGYYLTASNALNPVSRVIRVYPLKWGTDCTGVKNSNALAGPDDIPAKILLCLEDLK